MQRFSAVAIQETTPAVETAAWSCYGDEHHVLPTLSQNELDERIDGPKLLTLGRSSFYVFEQHDSDVRHE